MNRTIFFICFCLLFFTSCHTLKKIASNTTETVKIREQQNEVSTTETYSFVDTTKKSGTEISYYKIEFYPPAGPTAPNTIPNKTVFPEGINYSGSNPTTKPPNAGKGAIKSIEGYMIKAASEQTGRAEEIKGETTNKTAQNNTDITKTEKITEQPAPDPYRWRYVFGIVVAIILIGAIAHFGLRKTKIVVSIITFLKKIF